MGALIVHSEMPFNAEPPLARLRAAMLTRADDFYVRSHGAAPALDAGHRLHVGGLVGTPMTLSVAELQGRFTQRSVAAVLQCAGNRRADLQGVRPTSGDPWAGGAIGNAEWTGVALADVLRTAGVGADAGHVAFEGADEVESPGEARAAYAVSIPLRKALAPEVLLAWAMNGTPLRREHGFPLRAVVPGYAGVRSAKWLRGVTVRAAPSDSAMQARDYRLLPPQVTAETVDWSAGVVIEEMPINAAICEPAALARVPPGRTVVRGYAIASARAIVRVDVSGDGGRRWVQAGLEAGGSVWAWTFWEATLDLAPGEHEIVVRAWDAAGQTQPSRAEDVWNFKGYLSAAWHRVTVVAA